MNKKAHTQTNRTNFFIVLLNTHLSTFYRLFLFISIHAKRTQKNYTFFKRFELFKIVDSKLLKTPTKKKKTENNKKMGEDEEITRISQPNGIVFRRWFCKNCLSIRVNLSMCNGTKCWFHFLNRMFANLRHFNHHAITSSHWWNTLFRWL